MITKMSVFNRIRFKGIDEFTDWLDKYGMFDLSPWSMWFDRNYCKKCEPIIENGHEYGWCERHGKCRYFEEMNEAPSNKQIIKMWLESEDEYEDEDVVCTEVYV